MPGGWVSLGLRNGETVRLEVRGRCMRGPADGETVLVRRQPLYFPGDVVVVRGRDRWSAHRFLGYIPTRHGWAVLTRADASRSADPAARVARVVGRAKCEVTHGDRFEALQRYVQAVVERLARSHR